MPTWNATQIELQEALGLKVRLLSDEQIAAGWLGDPAAVDEVEELMKPMCSVGFVERREIQSHPLTDLSKPVVHKKPGDPPLTDEQVEQLADYFQNRWTSERQRFVVYVATKLGASFVGSHILEPPSEVQVPHDLHVSQLFVNIKQANDVDAMRFVIGEGSLPKLGLVLARFKDPDLFLVNANGEAQQILEHGGAYEFKHIRQFDLHCSGEAHAKLVKRFPNRKHRLYPDPNGTEYLLY